MTVNFTEGLSMKWHKWYFFRSTKLCTHTICTFLQHDECEWPPLQEYNRQSTYCWITIWSFVYRHLL